VKTVVIVSQEIMTQTILMSMLMSRKLLKINSIF
jgi:hypothetical protein